jgi:2,5-furandicarboxylate decarboxylase 1
VTAAVAAHGVVLARQESEIVMPYQDFRQFLDVLRQHGELVDIDRPVALSDVGKAMKQSYRGQGPGIAFNNNGAAFPLVAGVYSTRSKALLAFEADEKTILQKVLSGLDHPIAPEVSAAAAPCHDVLIAGEAIDLAGFPIPTYSPKDGGPYITPGIVVSKDPETGVPDIGHYRFLVLGKDTFSFSAQPNHRFGKNLAKCQRLGVKPMAALVIGVDPILAYACQVQASDTTNDWEVAGGLRGAPVALTHCKTCDLEVPAAAEVVIEFAVDMDETVMEGPLGEYTGYYTPPSLKPVARITAIAHRRNAIFQGLAAIRPSTVSWRAGRFRPSSTWSTANGRPRGSGARACRARSCRRTNGCSTRPTGARRSRSCRNTPSARPR